MSLTPPSWYRPVGVLLGVMALVFASRVSLLRLIDPGSGETGTGDSRRLLGPAQIGDGAFFFGFELSGPGEPCSSVPIGMGTRSSGAASVAIPVGEITVVETIFVDATLPAIDPGACPISTDALEAVIDPTSHGWRRIEPASGYEEVIDIRHVDDDVIVVWARSDTSSIDVAEVETIADMAVSQYDDRAARATGTLPNRMFVALILLAPAAALFGLARLLRRLALFSALVWTVLYSVPTLLVLGALGFPPLLGALAIVVVVLIGVARAGLAKEVLRARHPMPQAAGGPAAVTDPRSVLSAEIGSSLAQHDFAPVAGPCIDVTPAAVWQWWQHRDSHVVAEVLVHSKLMKRPVVSMMTHVGGRAELTTTNRGDVPFWFGGLQLRKPDASVSELWERHMSLLSEAVDLGVSIDDETSVNDVQRHHVAIVRAVGRMPLVCAVSAARSLVVGRMLKRWQPLLLRRWTLQRLAG